MKLGDTSIELVSDGNFLLDGGILFGAVRRTVWEAQLKPDRTNRVRLGLNCLLIQTGSENILVDTGAGGKRSERLKDAYGLSGNKLLTGLRRHGITARDVDKVVLTHLHFDHAGGCTKLDRSGDAIAVFPKAEYIVQQSAWDDANTRDERNDQLFHSGDFAPLYETGVLTLVNGDHEIAPGINLKVTNGHSKGHQIVLIEAGSERIAYMGDLMPTMFHIPIPVISSLDQVPNDTLDSKRDILRMAIDGGWLLVFGHANQHFSGYVEERNGQIQFAAKDL